MNFIIKSALDWLFNKAVELITFWFRLSAQEKENINDAEEVVDVAEQIKKLIREGKPVPQELKDKLRDKSHDLTDDIFKPGV